MRIVFAGGSGGLSASRLAKALVARGHGIVGSMNAAAVLDLPADWIVIDGRTELDGAIELALHASQFAQVAVMTEDGLRCARTWELFPRSSHKCARALEAHARSGRAGADRRRRRRHPEKRRRGPRRRRPRNDRGARRRRGAPTGDGRTAAVPRPPRRDDAEARRSRRAARAPLADRSPPSIPVLFATCVDDDRLPRDVPRLAKPLGVGPLVAAVHRYRSRAA